MLTLLIWKNLMQAAKTGDAYSQWCVGEYYSTGYVDGDGCRLVRKNRPLAAKWFAKSATQGYRDAQDSYAVVLSDGEGVPKNIGEAIIWLKRAFKNGSLCAANNMAKIKEELGDLKGAYLWYKKAYKLGEKGVLTDLEKCYFYGIGVRQNYKKAVECFREMARSNYVFQDDKREAMLMIAQAYCEGKGVRLSPALSHRWVSKAEQVEDY